MEEMKGADERDGRSGWKRIVGGRPEDFCALRLKAALTFFVYRLQGKV